MTTKIKTTFLLITLSFAIQATSLQAEEAYEVTTKAWTAFTAKEYDSVIAHADKANKIWGARAKETNSGLSALPEGDDVRGFANLNELATITWLKGEALRLKGEKEAAIATYKKLIADYKYGQCWDNKGWWWQPAKAAEKKIDELK